VCRNASANRGLATATSVQLSLGPGCCALLTGQCTVLRVLLLRRLLRRRRLRLLLLLLLLLLLQLR